MDNIIQIVLKTTDKKYAVPSAPITVPDKFTSTDLDKLVKDLLEDKSQIEFDFIIEKKFLLTSIHEFILENKLSSESLEIFYVVKQRSPKLEDDIELDDLISCVRRHGKYILISCYDGTIQVWPVNADEPIFTLPLGTQVKCVEWLSFDKENCLATFTSGSFDQVIRLWEWDFKNDKLGCKYALRGHKDTITCMKSNNNWLASGSQDCSIKIWSIENKSDSEINELDHKKKSSDDKVPTKIPEVTLTGHREMISAIDWVNQSSENVKSKIATVSWDHSLRLWDFGVGSGEETRCIMASHALNALHISAFDGRILTGSSDNKIRIYDLRSDEALSQIGFCQHNSWITSVSWSPCKENQFISGCVDGSVRLWDTRNSQAPLYQLMAHNEMVTTIDWSQPITDNKSEKHYILSGSADSTIKIFSVEQL